jgi:hypothetical protein
VQQKPFELRPGADSLDYDKLAAAILRQKPAA